jgi:endonuclease-3
MDKKRKVQEIIAELKRLFPNPTIALTYNSDFNLLVAVILSAQTTDKKVNEVTPPLFAKYKIAKDYAQLSQDELEVYIKSIGLYRGKAKNILATAKIIDEKYNGELPHSIREMVELPGVGRKTANVVLGIVYKIYEGIAVDTHVRRLSKLWGLTENTDPDKIEKDLMEIVPREDWPNFTYLVIDYGRAYCPASCHHETCPLRKYILQQ